MWCYVKSRHCSWLHYHRSSNTYVCFLPALLCLAELAQNTYFSVLLAFMSASPFMSASKHIHSEKAHTQQEKIVPVATPRWPWDHCTSTCAPQLLPNLHPSSLQSTKWAFWYSLVSQQWQLRMCATEKKLQLISKSKKRIKILRVHKKICATETRIQFFNIDRYMCAPLKQ